MSRNVWRFENEKTVKVQARMTEMMVNVLKDIADKEGLTISQVIRRSCLNYIDSKWTTDQIEDWYFDENKGEKVKAVYNFETKAYDMEHVMHCTPEERDELIKDNIQEEDDDSPVINIISEVDLPY